MLKMDKKNRIPWNKGKKSPETSGEKNWRWKGENAGYSAIHVWLIRSFGKANRCEGVDCYKKSNSYEWALLKGRSYSRDRDNFHMLCKSCHRRYDMTSKEKEFIVSRERDSNGRFL